MKIFEFKDDRKALITIIKSILVAIAFGVLGVVVLSIVGYFLNWEKDTINFVTYLIFLLSVFGGAFSGSKCASKKGWVLGVIVALATTLLMYIFCLVINGFELNILQAILKIPFLLIVGAIGGMVGINVK